MKEYKMAKYEYDYYSEADSDQFRFLRIPKVFFEDPDYEKLGSDEKILYGFLHEQVDLSRKKGWIDEDGHIYVMRSLESIQQILHNCSPDKARATVKNLMDFGLIEKVRRGQGKPDLIYVKNFITKKAEISSSGKMGDSGQHFSESGNSGFLKQEKPHSGSGKFRVLESGKTDPIDTNINNTKAIETPSFNHSGIETYGTQIPAKALDDGLMDKASQKEKEKKAYEELIKENLNYDLWMHDLKDPSDRKMFDDYYNLILEIVVGDTEEYRINNTVFPQEIVKSRMLKLDGEDVVMAIEQVNNYPEKIHNIRNFMISTLYNASVTTRTMITNDVQYHMMNGWRNTPETREA